MLIGHQDGYPTITCSPYNKPETPYWETWPVVEFYNQNRDRRRIIKAEQIWPYILRERIVQGGWLERINRLLAQLSCKIIDTPMDYLRVSQISLCKQPYKQLSSSTIRVRTTNDLQMNSTRGLTGEGEVMKFVVC